MVFGMITSRGVTYLSSELLDATQGVKHAFGSRVGGVSHAPFSSLNMGFGSGDDPSRVQQNWQNLQTAMGLSGRPMVHLVQVHSDRVIRVHETPQTPFVCAGEADALFTTQPRIMLCIITADCLPVLIAAGTPARCVAAIHAGWRGVLSGVVPATIEQMVEQPDLGLSPSDLTVAVGPHIRSCCFEVGPEVVDQFETAGVLEITDVHPGDGGRSFVDLAAILTRQLVRLGVPSDRIEAVRHCTRCRPDLFFSYRRDGSGRGMLGATISLEG